VPQRRRSDHAVAIYPGSFDPPTYGHLDLIQRGSRLFERLEVAILRNPEKDPLFTIEERSAMLQTLTRKLGNVHIGTFDGLLVNYAREVKAGTVLRGIRAISDYEYELQMALMNRKLEPTLETVFMPAAEIYSYVSSRLVKEIVRLGGKVTSVVPPLVEEHLQRKLNGKTAPPAAPPRATTARGGGPGGSQRAAVRSRAQIQS
jgi:pantetheine-phosphate adenylyltransferase